MSLVRTALSLICAVLALGLAVTPSPARADADGALPVGIVGSTFEWGPGTGRQLDHVRAVGATWVREEMAWSDVQPRRGRWDWKKFDAGFETAARRGIRVLPLLTSPPRWAESRRNALPRNPRAFARFTARVVARYGPKGHFWRARPRLPGHLAPQWFEIWNEPYYPAFSDGRPSPTRYARLFRAAVRAGRRANRRARFLLQVEEKYRAPDGEWKPWVPALFRAMPRLGRWVDGVAFHPYTLGPPTAAEPDRWGLTFSRVDRLRAQLAARGAAGRPFWFTEVGWSTCSRRPECVSLEAQRAHLDELFTILASRPQRDRPEATFIYHLRDWGDGEGDRVRRFGLLDRDDRPKPAWHVVRRATLGRPLGGDRVGPVLPRPG